MGPDQCHGLRYIFQICSRRAVQQVHFGGRAAPNASLGNRLYRISDTKRRFIAFADCKGFEIQQQVNFT